MRLFKKNYYLYKNGKITFLKFFLNTKCTTTTATTTTSTTGTAVSAHLDSPVKTKNEEAAPTPPTAPPSRKSTRTRNSLSASSVTNREVSSSSSSNTITSTTAANRSEEPAELIFTPLIKYKNNTEAEDKTTISKIDVEASVIIQQQQQ